MGVVPDRNQQLLVWNIIAAQASNYINKELTLLKGIIQEGHVRMFQILHGKSHRQAAPIGPRKSLTFCAGGRMTQAHSDHAP